MPISQEIYVLSMTASLLAMYDIPHVYLKEASCTPRGFKAPWFRTAVLSEDTAESLQKIDSDVIFTSDSHSTYMKVKQTLKIM
jgi:hypothetical protein